MTLDQHVAVTAVTTYTHPDVLDAGVRDGWADPRTDPTLIDWPARQAAAAIPFCVVDGRPVNPCESTAVRYGRNELGHWGEALAADAIVTATDHLGRRWIVLIEREDGHGWALPGGHVDPGEDPADAAVRELAEETGLRLPGADWQILPARYVPDPRASDEAWMVTVPARTELGPYLDPAVLPTVVGATDAVQAAWIRADTYDMLARALADNNSGDVFAAHQQLLRDVLNESDADMSGCPNCGAPTGGRPCTNSYSGGPSCADVLAAHTAPRPDNQPF